MSNFIVYLTGFVNSFTREALHVALHKSLLYDP